MFKRVRSKSVVASVVALVTGIVATCLLIDKIKERTDVVSKPVMGYRYHFTRPSDWHIAQDYSDASHGMPEAYTFVPTPRPIREWIAVHLFHQPPHSVPFIVEQPRYSMETETALAAPHDIQIKSGYPEPDFQGRMQVLSERHLRIDACPATVFRCEMVLQMGTTFHVTMLIVYQPDTGNEYTLQGWAERHYSDQIDREMQAIIASFHVEKVAAPVGSKH